MIADLYAGRPVGYTTFLAYDEVAHHSGRRARRRARDAAPRRPPDRAASWRPRRTRRAPTSFVVLSDHGQSQGETFLDRYGETLEELVREACETDAASRPRTRDTDEALELPRRLADRGQRRRRHRRGRGDPARRRKSRRVDGEVQLGRGRARRRDRPTTLPELSVMASGCLGLISFPREPGRVSLERIEQLLPAT